MLGLPDSSKLSLFAGPELINRHADLSQAPIADGVAWIHKGMQVLVVFCFVLCFLFYSMYVRIYIYIKELYTTLNHILFIVTRFLVFPMRSAAIVR